MERDDKKKNYYLDPDKLEASIARDMADGKLSDETIGYIWLIIDNIAKKGNFANFDEDTIGDMKLKAFELFRRYWNRYDHYMVTVDGGESWVPSCRVAEARKTAVSSGRYGGLSTRRNSAFSYFSKLVINAFKSVINTKRKSIDGFGYEVGARVDTIGGRVVVPHRVREAMRPGESAGDGERAVSEAGDDEQRPPYQIPHLDRIDAIRYQWCDSSYPVVYDREKIVDEYYFPAEDIGELYDAVYAAIGVDREIEKAVASDWTLYRVLDEFGSEGEA